MVETLGVKMNSDEVDEAMEIMDKDGSGEVDFDEFYRWWTDDSTAVKIEKAKERLEAVKELFQDLDDDFSGSLDRDEVAMLAVKLTGVKLNDQDLDTAMGEMDSDN
eukprot:SAG11_NODE_4311_length_1953_cov_1.192017_1_plen_105_part_10